MTRKTGINNPVSKLKDIQKNKRDTEHKIIEKTVFISAIFLINSMKIASIIAIIATYIKSGIQRKLGFKKMKKIFSLGEQKRIIK